jgi:hypothetical protein
MGGSAMSELIVTSCVSHDFAATAKFQMCRDIINGWGYDYRYYVDYTWAGWASKLFYQIDFFSRPIDARYVMFVDASDVMVLCGQEELLSRWRKFGHPWVFNAEPHIWSPGSFKPEDYPTPPDAMYRYLNSGAYIGEVDHIRYWLSRWTDGFTYRPRLPHGDQDWYAARFIRHYPDAIVLDTNCEVFQCMCGSDDKCLILPGRVHNNVTGTDPVVIHWNGGNDVTEKQLCLDLAEGLL